MSDPIAEIEMMSIMPPEVWGPTLGLRVKEQEDGKCLVEQLWRSNLGNGEWRKLPFVGRSEGGE